ncbi:MAG TPA: hydrogenase maturation nickel metallochaperone HypA [Pasteurellaceae bacterium]|nr:hydrogenase maturation nickel metallochaperone HypA [Pasteurellaceae bacterium]
MHEMSLCQNIMDIVERQCREHKVKKVTDLWLEIGALSCVEQSSLAFCFEISGKGTPMENCKLHFILIPAQAYCWQCQKIVEIQAYQDCCPVCGGIHLQRQSGDELRIKEIAVE